MPDPHVLVLDLEPRTDLPDFQGPRWLPPGTPCTVVKAVKETLPASTSGYTHLVLSGSTSSCLDDDPWVEPTLALIRDAVARGIPSLGICYGHQLLVRALLGTAHLRRRERVEVGWLPITVHTSPRGLFDGLPNPFRVFVGHYDEVVDLPDDWTVTTTSAECAVQGFICARLRLLGFQFHPEMDLAVGNTCFQADREVFAGLGIDVDRDILADAAEDGSGAVLFPRFVNYPWP